MQSSSFSTWGRVFGVMLMLGLLALFTGAVSAQDDITGFTDEGDGFYSFTNTSGQQFYPVIVTLDTPFQVETELSSASAVTQQRSAIQNAQGAVLNALNNSGATVSNVHRYQTIPHMALWVDDAGAAALQNNVLVTNITPDHLSEPQMLDSNVIIGSQVAWDAGYTGDGYAVAVLDTGVDYNHPALAGKNIREACFNTIFPGFVDSLCPNGQESQVGPGAAAVCAPTPADSQLCGHGTHVAGTVAGYEPDVEVGVDFQGVAYEADIIGLNVFSFFRPGIGICSTTGAEADGCVRSYSSDQIKALEYLYQQSVFGGGVMTNIAAANLSLGGDQYFSEQACLAAYGGVTGPYPSVLRALNSANIAVVSSSGNAAFKDSMGGPACLPGMISVGATTVAASDDRIDLDDEVAFFSNSADFLDILAPGFFIQSTMNVGTGDDTRAGWLGSNYEYYAGTSMAAPHVAGAFAVMREADPTATVDQILNHLKATGTPITDNGQTWPVGTLDEQEYPGNGQTYPRLDLANAVLPSVQLLGPVGSTALVSPTFTWDGILADTYTITVYASDESVVETASGVTDESYTLTAPLTIGEDYFWEVFGTNGTGDGPVGSGDFTVNAVSPDGDASLVIRPLFTFQDSVASVGGPVWYNIRAEVGGTQVASQWFQATNICASGTCQTQLGTQLGVVGTNSEVNWYLNSWNGSALGTEDGPFIFNILGAEVLAPTDLDSPSATPSFQINQPMAGNQMPDWYRVVVLDSTGALAYDEWYEAASTCGVGASCSMPAVERFASGDYTIWMNTYSIDGGFGPWTGNTQFTMAVPAPTNEGFELFYVFDDYNNGGICQGENIDEVCTSTNIAFDFTWSNFSNFPVDWINIRVDQDGVGTIYNEWFNTDTDPFCEPFNGWCDVEVDPSFFQDGGSYTWYARTWSEDIGLAPYTVPGDATAGDPYDAANFTIDVPETGAVTLYTPVDTAIVSSLDGVTARWSRDAAATWYGFYLSTSGGASVATIWNTAEDLGCDTSGNNCGLDLTGVTLPAGVYSWTVATWGPGNSGIVQSAPSTFQYLP